MKNALASPRSVRQYTPEILCAPRIEANTWVRLLQLPSEFCFDEALLLCQVAFDEWLAWAPNHGEVCLNTAQFECIS